jgi:NhaP-type Na+/H+ or K+/H+ antiporter
LIRNIPLLAHFHQIDQTWARAIFQLSFVLIMIRCGINLDTPRLRKSWGVILSLGLISTSVEAGLIIAVAFLFHMPIGLAILFG